MGFSINGFGNNSFGQIGNNYNQAPPPPPPPPGGMAGINGQNCPPPPPPPNGFNALSGQDAATFSGDALSSLTGDGINGQLQQILQNLMQGGSTAF